MVKEQDHGYKLGGLVWSRQIDCGRVGWINVKFAFLTPENPYSLHSADTDSLHNSGGIFSLY